jgi:regulatory protein
MNEDLELEHIIARAAARCAQKECSSKGIFDWLANQNIQSESAELIIEHLEKEGYIDNLRYAKAYANDKIKFNKWGKYKVFMMLTGQISEETVKLALDEMDTDFYQNLVFDELRKKDRTIKTSILAQRKQKLLSFASSRGYEFELVQKYIELTK